LDHGANGHFRVASPTLHSADPTGMPPISRHIGEEIERLFAHLSDHSFVESLS
jgi:hypothetical protein